MMAEDMEVRYNTAVAAFKAADVAFKAADAAYPWGYAADVRWAGRQRDDALKGVIALRKQLRAAGYGYPELDRLEPMPGGAGPKLPGGGESAEAAPAEWPGREEERRDRGKWQ